jgi:hypothetical protein
MGRTEDKDGKPDELEMRATASVICTHTYKHTREFLELSTKHFSYFLGLTSGCSSFGYHRDLQGEAKYYATFTEGNIELKALEGKENDVILLAWSRLVWPF